MSARRDFRPAHRRRVPATTYYALAVACVLAGAGVIGGCAVGATGAGAPTPTASWVGPTPTISITPQGSAGSARTYRKLTARQMALLERDPDAHRDESYIVYGVVVQADASLGASVVRAGVSYRRERDPRGDYGVNAMMSGRTEAMSGVIEGELFVARVRVAGSITYDTIVGGSVTCPQLVVDSIEITGKVNL